MIEKKFISADDMTVSDWSGGKTIQIAIFPENAVYAERNFLWRVSTATVDAEESDFTLLPDYDRIIASLKGSMLLSHKNGESIRIMPCGTVYNFDGGIDTHCIGKASDLNLMMRKGRVSGNIEFLKENEEKTLSLKENETALVYYIDENRAVIFTGTGEIFLPAEGRRALFTIKLLNK